MALNSDSGWILKQAMFQKAVTGSDVKERLADCMEALMISHNFKVHKATKEKLTTYTFNNTNVKKDKYACTVIIAMTVNDGAQDCLIENTATYSYSKVKGSKKASTIQGDRLKIYFLDNRWNLVWLTTDSEGHDKDYTVSWSATDETHDIFSVTFPPVTTEGD